MIARGDAKPEVITARLGSTEVAPQTIRLNPNETLRIEGLSFEKAKIDIIGPDMIVTDTTTGNKLIVPGIGLFMFSSGEAPEFFFDGKAVTSEDILGKIGFIVNLTDKDYITYTSLHLNEHQKEKDADVSEDDAALQVAMMMRQEEIPQDQPISPEELLTETGTDVGEEPLVTSAIGQPPLPGGTPSDSGAPPSTSMPDAGGERTTFDFDSRLLQVQSYEDNSAGRVIYGGGGSTLSSFYPASTYQYSTEIIDTGSDNSDVTIYADDPAKFGTNEMSRVLQLSPNLPNGFEVTSVTITGLPAGFDIPGAIYNAGDGSYTLTAMSFDPAGNINLEIHYTNMTPQSFDLTIDAIATFDPGSGFPVPTNTVLDFSFQNKVHVKPVNSPADYVMGDDWVLSTTANENRITTGGGNDHIYGGAGVDTVIAGAGDDFVSGGMGNDDLDGGLGTDTLDYSYASDNLTVDLALGTMTGGAGDSDTIAGFENITGGSGDDVLRGSDDVANIILGGDGNDDIYGGRDTVNGGADYRDVMDGGAGINTLRFHSSASLYIDMTNLDGDGFWEAYDQNSGNPIFAKNFSVIHAGDGYNYITFSDFDVTYYGGSAEDEIYDFTAGGNNTVYGGSGSDFIYFLAGGNHYIDAGADNDFVFSGVGNDTLIGGSGVDRIDFNGLGSGVTVDLSVTTAQNTGGAGVDTISGFENVTGTNFNDTITGDTQANVINGLNGDDIINGADGDDTIDGGLGNDTLTGGNGTDTLSYSFATGAVTIDLSLTTAQVTGGAGTDTISGFENVTGSGFNDIILGNAGNNTLNGAGGINTLSYANAGGGVTISLAVATAQNTGGAGTDTISNFRHLSGSEFADVLTGDGLDNTINGQNGDDTIEGGLGNDTLIGGGGTDTLSYVNATSAVTINLGTGSVTGGAGTDTVSTFENATGSAHNDSFTGDGNNNVFNGGNGNDTFNYSAGNDTFDGGAGSNTVGYDAAGALGNITLDMSTVDINGFSQLTFSGSAKVDLLKSVSVFYFQAGNDVITGASGNETFHLRGGNDTLHAGLGTDTLAYTFDSAVVVDLIAGTATGNGNDTFTGIENIHGAYAAADTLRGDNGANTIYGDSGISHVANQGDIIDGRGGDDFLYGEGGNDVINGGDGNDYMDGGNNSDGSSGSDTLTYADATSGITMNLSLTTAQATGGSGTDTVLNFENIIGSAFADALGGTAGNNSLQGGDGNDWLNGWSGDDTVDGGSGSDTATYQNATSAVNVNLSVQGVAQNTGGDGIDTLISIENLAGSTFSDILRGDGNANTIYGLAGDDTILALNGNDTVFGGDNGDTIDGGGGDDMLYGDGGNDVIEGGAGNDTIDGGAGGDRLIFNSATNPVTINMSLGTATGDGNDTFTSIEAFTGSSNSDTFNLTAATFLSFTNVSGGGGAADRVNLTGNLDAISGASMNSLFDDVDVLNLGGATRSTALNFTNTDIDGMNGAETTFRLVVAQNFNLQLNGGAINTTGVSGSTQVINMAGINVTVEIA